MLRNAGLTLLELLIVVLILSALALSAVSLVDLTDHQLRHQETQGRLQELRNAIVGEGGDRALSGYVVDLGVLPANVTDLIALPAGAEPFGSKDPELPGSSTSSAAVHALPKGWRGPYVVLPPSGSSTPRFRDGWGNVSRDPSGDPDPVADDLEHGWVFDEVSGALTITSRGADGLPGSAGETEWDGDLAVTVAASDWQVDLSGWSVDLLNATGEKRSGLSVRLLVYTYNETSGAVWSTYDTGTIDLPDQAAASVTFAASTVVPAGRHMLVVVDGDEQSTIRAARQVAFMPRSLPQVTLVIQ